MDLSAGCAAFGARTSGAARERRLTRRDNRLWLLMTGIQYARCAGARNTVLQHKDYLGKECPRPRGADGDKQSFQARLLSAMTLLRIGLSTNRAKATTPMFIKAVTTNTACQLP